jgi:steroid delta-isomerase-like uncharacterized protein
MTLMTAARNRTSVLRFFREVIGAGNLDLLDELAVDDYEDHVALPGQGRGREGLKRRVDKIRAAFRPRHQLHHVIVEADRVAVHWTLSGVHSDEFLGLAPTSKRVEFDGVDIYAMRDGRMAAHWNVVDMWAFYRQVGEPTQDQRRKDRMSETENKQVLRRYYEEILMRGRLDVLETIARVDFVEHNPFPGHGQGLEGLRQRANTLFTALKQKFTLELLIAERDTVAVLWTTRGTHVGDFNGIPPTGKSYTIQGIDIFQFRDGRMAEHWDVVDIYGFLSQIGALPAPSATTAQ